VLLTPKDAPVTDTYKHTWWYHGVWKCHGFDNLLTLLPERVCYQQPLVEWMEISIQKWFFGLTQVFVCMHYIHTTPAQTPKLSGPQFQTFFWGFPLYKPICFRWNLENINIYITLIFPKIFNTTQILHVFIIPCFWVFAHTGAPVALNGRWVSTSAGWARDWVLMRLLGFSWDCLGSHTFIWFVVNILELSRVCTYLEPL
jgi:hypothetical protein